MNHVKTERLDLALTATLALLCSCAAPVHTPEAHSPIDPMTNSTTTEPTYTFVSVSTAKPGKLQALAALASRPGELMDEAIDGVIARQVGVDEARNSVVVWVTLDRKESMDAYLATDQGRADHGEGDDLSSIIDTFQMYDLVPVSGRLR